LLFLAKKNKKAKPEKIKTPVKDSIKITSFGLSVGSYILFVSLFVTVLINCFKYTTNKSNTQAKKQKKIK